MSQFNMKTVHFQTMLCPPPSHHPRRASGSIAPRRRRAAIQLVLLFLHLRECRPGQATGAVVNGGAARGGKGARVVWFGGSIVCTSTDDAKAEIPSQLRLAR